jgi:hypothetical protein
VIVVKHTTATFRQADHHDFLEFPNGQKVLLTDLLVGQEATVLQLPAQPIWTMKVTAAVSGRDPSQCR